MAKLEKKNLIHLIVSFAVMVVLTAALVVGNCVAFYFEIEIDSALTQPMVNKEALALTSEMGQKLSKRIVEEGSVLLKNGKNEGSETPVLPLSDTIDKVNVFGWHSIDWLYGTGGGGGASGGVLPEDDDFSKNVDLYKALDNAGISYNTKLQEMYNKYHAPLLLAQSWKYGTQQDGVYLYEPSVNDATYYSNELKSYSESYSDTALVVISRGSGEGSTLHKHKQEKRSNNNANIDDTSKHQLELSTEERDLLTYVGSKFENVVVLLNMTNSFECGFLDEIPGIDACMLVGYTGTRAATAIPDLLWGKTNPSGRLSDTYVYDHTTNPAFVYQDVSLSSGHHSIDCVEGIYVGYKWYETADAEGLWTKENGYENGYDSVVKFPFGYGLSYTTFDWTVEDVKLNGESIDPTASDQLIDGNSKFEFTVSVKNTGDKAGREVVEIYATPPYDKTTAKVEKSSVSLVSFAKTNVLEPSASETLTLEVSAYDFASYDCYNLSGIVPNGGYVLEAGDYALRFMKDCHHDKDVTYKTQTVRNGFTFKVDTTKHIETDPVTGNKVQNLFTGDTAIDSIPIDGKTSSFDPNIPWFSRASFKKPADWTRYTTRTATPGTTSYTDPARWQAWDNATGNDEFGNPIPTQKPTWGSTATAYKLANDKGVISELGKKLGADYNAPEWEDVLNQITLDEALRITNRYYGSKEINSVGKPKLTDYDGPSQIKGYNAAPRGVGYPCMVVLAQSWNQKLAYEFGKSYGDDMKALGVNGLWGFAIDIHRDPFFSRQFESPSEDAYLAGAFLANSVRGLNTRGRYNFVKHFALYNGYSNHTALTEQSYREIYLSGHRRLIVEGGALGLMTSYQSVGGENFNSTLASIQGVLRNEWGFNGAITSDSIGGRDCQIDTLLRIGGNYGMNVSLGTSSWDGGVALKIDANSSARVQHRLRESMHQVIYSWLRADYNFDNAPEDDDLFISSTSIQSWCWWKPLLYTIDVFFGLTILTWTAILLHNTFVKDDEKKDEEKRG